MNHFFQFSRKNSPEGFLPHVLLCALLLFSGINCQARNPELDIEEILLNAESADIGRLRLQIEQIIDSDVDIEAVYNDLKYMAQVVSRSFRPDMASAEKMQLLLMYLFTPGEWNQYRPFRYDLGDPSGKEKPENALLSNLLYTRQGNCVSMPFLVVILGEMLDINVTLARAPEHLYIVFLESETGNQHNLEVTSGGYVVSDHWMKEKTGVSDAASDSGAYLKPLSKQQVIAESLLVLAFNALESGDPEYAIEVGSLVVTYDPTSISAMLVLATAYGQRLWSIIETNGYAHLVDIPYSVRNELRFLDSRQRYWYEKAKHLGWDY